MFKHQWRPYKEISLDYLSSKFGFFDRLEIGQTVMDNLEVKDLTVTTRTKIKTNNANALEIRDSSDNYVFRVDTIAKQAYLYADFNIVGDLNYIDTQVLNIQDQYVRLTTDQETTDAVDAGLLQKYYSTLGGVTRHRGLIYDISDQYWKFITNATSEDTQVATFGLDKLKVQDLDFYGGLLYNGAACTTSQILEGANLYYTQARFDTAFGAKSTTNLAEGTTNLYFTNARARASLFANAPLAYDSGTGIISSLYAYNQNLTTTSNVQFGNLTGSGSLQGFTDVYLDNPASSVEAEYLLSRNTLWTTSIGKFSAPTGPKMNLQTSRIDNTHPTRYGPNATWNEYLDVGGDGNWTTNASIKTTNGNLHIDPKVGGYATYINYYNGSGGTLFGNGSGAITASYAANGWQTCLGTATFAGTALPHHTMANNAVTKFAFGLQGKEDPGDVGCDLTLERYSNSGTLLGSTRIKRSNGDLILDSSSTIRSNDSVKQLIFNSPSYWIARFYRASTAGQWSGIGVGGDNAQCIMGEFNASNQATFGAHSVAYDAWAPMYLSGGGQSIYLNGPIQAQSNNISGVNNVSATTLTTNTLTIGAQTIDETDLANLNAIPTLASGTFTASITPASPSDYTSYSQKSYYTRVGSTITYTCQWSTENIGSSSSSLSFVLSDFPWTITNASGTATFSERLSTVTCEHSSGTLVVSVTRFFSTNFGVQKCYLSVNLRV